jgi:uncharacterized protein YcaQ
MASIAWLRQQALGWSLASHATLATALASMEFVQCDPIRAPARAQDLILRHRADGYRAGDLERRYPQLDVDEDYFYVYGVAARRLRPLLHPRRPGAKHVPQGLEARVLAFVKRNGVTHPRELQAEFGSDRVPGDWGGQSAATTQILDVLHHRGLLRVARRDSGVRVYEPAPPLGRALDPDRRVRALVLLAARSLAPVPEETLSGTVSRLCRVLRGVTGRAVIRELLAAGDLEGRHIDSIHYLWPAELVPVETEPPARVRFLAPFDPVVWDRRRFEHVWGWAYRFEAYTPAAKRRLGYYAMPLLWRENVIGWTNCTRGPNGLTVDVGYVDRRPRQRLFASALDEEIARLEDFLSHEAGPAD